MTNFIINNSSWGNTQAKKEWNDHWTLQWSWTMKWKSSRKWYEITYQGEHCLERKAGKILCGGFSEQQLPQIWGTTGHQEIYMPNKFKIKISPFKIKIILDSTRLVQHRNLNNLIEFNVQYLIELWLRYTIPVGEKRTMLSTEIEMIRNHL